MSRKLPFVQAGWKCNGTKESVSKLMDAYCAIDTNGMDVVSCPSVLHMNQVQQALNKSGTSIMLGAQNVSATGNGAFTGEISALQLADFGVSYVMIGHSERKQYYQETMEIVSKKIKMCLLNNLNIIVCLGETLNDRKSNMTEQVCFEQLHYIFDAASNTNGFNIEQDFDRIILLYEPIWAIGTGIACDAEMAQQTHQSLRKWIKENVSNNVSDNIRIVYGGSVNSENVLKLIKQDDIDGVGVGKASLDAPSFQTIIEIVKDAYQSKFGSNDAENSKL